MIKNIGKYLQIFNSKCPNISSEHIPCSLGISIKTGGSWVLSVEGGVQRGRNPEERLTYLSSTSNTFWVVSPPPAFTMSLSDTKPLCLGEKKCNSLTPILPFSLLSGFLRVFHSLFLQIKEENIVSKPPLKLYPFSFHLEDKECM